MAVLRVNGQLHSYPLESAACDCEYPCSCVMFEGERFDSPATVISKLVEERDGLREALREAEDA